MDESKSEKKSIKWEKCLKVGTPYDFYKTSLSIGNYSNEKKNNNSFWYFATSPQNIQVFAL